MEASQQGKSRPLHARALVQAVKRNIERFPIDFMFRLSAREFADCHYF